MHNAPTPDSPPGVQSRPVSRQLALSALGWAAVPLFSLLTAVGAEIRIPLQPVPITLQTLFVLLAGSILGSARGSLSQVLYLVLGISGIPLFAGHAAGMAVITGPTGGYLLGFTIAPFLIGRILARDGSTKGMLLAYSTGALSILSLGTLRLALFTGDPTRALLVGFLPFLPGEVAKIAAACSIQGSYTALRASLRSGHTD